MDVITISLAFIEGLALIASPCILPILPIILSGSITGSKARPIGIIIGFIIAFTLVTLFVRQFIQYTSISQDLLRNIAFVILLLLGMILLSTHLTEKFNLLTQKLTSIGSTWSTANNPQGGLFGGILFGALIGIVWTPCAGPILAAVIIQVAIQQTNWSSILVVFAFAIGAALPMFLIALLGRSIVNKFSFFKEHTYLLRKILGVIIILSVIFLYYFPITSFTYSPSKSYTTITPITSNALIDKLQNPYPAPEIEGIDAWINSSPLSLNDLKGKVILIDFWTYSCINCIRTLPYLKSWYQKYHDMGFIIIGVHSPEFQFEHDLNNVKTAVSADGILYPVALDNRFVTWQNYHNLYWPAHYLIDKNGYVVYEHFGEGAYDVTENNIRVLLGITKPMQAEKPSENISEFITPETYLGYARAENFSSPEIVSKDKVGHYTFPKYLSINGWALQGDWEVHSDKIVSMSPNASIQLHFNASHVYAVMGTTKEPITIKVYLNNVYKGEIKVTGHQLYTLVDSQKNQEGIIQLIITSPGLEIYTFTFG